MAQDPSVLAEDDAFFIGTAVRILPAIESDLGEFNDRPVFTPVVIRVEASIRGHVPERAVVMDVGGALPNGVGVGGEGTIGFRAGQRYVVAGTEDADGTYRVDACTESGVVSDADAGKLIRLAGGRKATRPSSIPSIDPAEGSGSSTLVILAAFLAGAGLSTALVLARRRQLADAGRSPSTD
jgi:hypothetical protein